MEETIQDQTEQKETADSVLLSVSYEYLAKKKRKRKITFSIICGLIVALAVTIIVLAAVKTNLKPFFIERPDNIEVYIDGDMHFTPNDDNYDEFYDIYDNSFKTSILTAMFTGKLGGYDIVETNQYFYSSASSTTGMSSDLINALGENYVHLYYEQAQTMYSANGKEYYSIRNTDEYLLSFKDVYFNISAENADHELTFYFGTSSQNYSNGRITKITIRANTYALYDYVANN